MLLDLLPLFTLAPNESVLEDVRFPLFASDHSLTVSTFTLDATDAGRLLYLPEPETALDAGYADLVPTLFATDAYRDDSQVTLT